MRTHVLIGRDAEVRQLEAAVRLVAARIPANAEPAFHVSGPENIGKTMLINRVRANLADCKNAVCIGPDAEGFVAQMKRWLAVWL
ncbi:ATP-binding protein, partial [Novosphingobium beihaiensis]